MQTTQASLRHFITARTVLAIIGLALLAVAVLSGLLGLSKSSGMSTGKLFVALMGGVVFITALVVPTVKRLYNSTTLLQRTWSIYKITVLTIVHVLLFCLLVEGVLRAANDRQDSIETDERWASLDYYASQSWLADFLNERLVVVNNLSYHPYVVWRRSPFEGSTININADGLRVTPGANCGADDAYRVFVFGGSTMWGTGSPDWGTIPAYLQTDLEALTGRPVCVVNYGETAYVSTQGVIQLMLNLQSGQIPDLVIFYDGANDPFGAYQNGMIAHHNLDSIAARFEQDDLGSVFLREFRDTRLFYLFRSVLPRSGTPASVPTANLDTMADAVVNAYLTNYRIVGALAEEYDFDYLFFWQPVMYAGHKTLTDQEREGLARVGVPEIDEALANMYQAAYERIEIVADQYDNLYYIADIFDDQETLIYIDALHVIPPGNEMVAQEMVTRIEPLLLENGS